MNPDLAQQNLQTIRLLMERSALYRRALAPIMLVAGTLGSLSAAAGLLLHLQAARAFASLWLGTACVVLTTAFLLVRQQAFHDREPFWSPPTSRVAQALLPPLLSGLCLSLLPTFLTDDWSVDFVMVLSWLFFYGCSLHSAGFFMLRGIKWFGWIFISIAILLIISAESFHWHATPAAANWFMGSTFGGLHLAYGVYLYFTERESLPA